MLPRHSMLTIINRAAQRAKSQTPIFRAALLLNSFNRFTLSNPSSPFTAGRVAAGVLLPVVLLSGCTPPGPRALLEGKRLIEQGKYSKAVEKLKSATSLIATNGQAWNYLGLACHYAGQA